MLAAGESRAIPEPPSRQDRQEKQSTMFERVSAMGGGGAIRGFPVVIPDFLAVLAFWRFKQGFKACHPAR
jgi:hypothetical protein